GIRRGDGESETAWLLRCPVDDAVAIHAHALRKAAAGNHVAIWSGAAAGRQRLRKGGAHHASGYAGRRDGNDRVVDRDVVCLPTGLVESVCGRDREFVVAGGGRGTIERAVAGQEQSRGQ